LAVAHLFRGGDSDRQRGAGAEHRPHDRVGRADARRSNCTLAARTAAERAGDVVVDAGPSPADRAATRRCGVVSALRLRPARHADALSGMRGDVEMIHRSLICVVVLSLTVVARAADGPPTIPVGLD